MTKRKHKHPDTRRLEWVAQYHFLIRKRSGEWWAYISGQYQYYGSICRAIDAAMRHQRKNGGGK